MANNYPQQPSGYTPQPPYGQPSPYGQPPYGQPYAQPVKTNGFAIAGFVLSVLLITWILGLIFSIIGLVQINNSNGTQKGKGLAIAGIVICGVLLLGYLGNRGMNA